MLATVAGLFCVPDGFYSSISHESPQIFFLDVLALPAISFLATEGIYVLNDLADIKIDQVNNKKRPLTSGRVSKTNAIFFMVLVNGIACALALTIENSATLIVLALLIALGPLYSAPRIGLKDRFVLKTLSIAAGMILCLLLGATAEYESTKQSQSWLTAWYGAAMVGMMTFVTSPYNDLGDRRGDLESGRRTIPIVLGPTNTLYMISVFAAAMLVSAWCMYFLGFIGWPASVCQTAVTVFMIFTAFNTLNRKDDEAYIRQRHSKMVRLHFLVHAGIILGVLIA
jgi:4-hydroxybenzoate polyprenyltransferase